MGSGIKLKQKKGPCCLGEREPRKMHAKKGMKKGTGVLYREGDPCAGSSFLRALRAGDFRGSSKGRPQ